MCIKNINSTILWMIKLMVFEEKVKICNLLMVMKLELGIIVQLLHIITTGFWFDIEKKERKKKTKQKYATTALITPRKCLGMVLIVISYYDVHRKHNIQLLLMESLKNILC